MAETYLSAWPLGDQHGYSIKLCTCEDGAYLGARQMGQVCRCERCGLMTDEQWSHIATSLTATPSPAATETAARVQAKVDGLIDALCDCGDFDGHPGDCAATHAILVLSALLDELDAARERVRVVEGERGCCDYHREGVAVHTQSESTPAEPDAGEVRETAMRAVVDDAARDFIVEALSWAETTSDGRLGYEHAEAMLAALLDRERRAGKAEGLREAADQLDDHTACACEDGDHIRFLATPKWLRDRADRIEAGS